MDLNTDEKGKEKKLKFLNFCLNLAIKSGFRKWREVTFGLRGGDPRYKVLLIQERDRIRREYYEPVRKMRENIKILHKLRVQQLNKRARTQREFIRQWESNRRTSVDSV